jgi:hypothetical protein
MTKLTFAILATLSLAAISLTAQTVSSITVTVPFNFSAGTSALPAGEYTVRIGLAPNTLWIRSADSKMNLVLLSNSARFKPTPGTAHLMFNRYGDHYFLSQISDGTGSGSELPKSPAEREQIAASRTSPALVAVAATR